ncbi:MAG: hypothetical protein A3I68_09110 [Candidatus Melainabacteria bacterium RIFCSPLOWO2_02_FULL_35_15]|nr:MAG: hypothetical protein A3F80_03295 [Candidatus Melainabacteria bacterium RIFCSPLOWO2_12_FULL_35_11]OGI13678.1 MAG: hypothetical protein A3I68_09110 [Candidatus Melainabacteria bacterium RIFCSPLOWO2_02_FULL_35_15]
MEGVNQNNNDAAVRRAELQRQLDSLPPTASDQERQALQVRLDALGSGRDAINNNQAVQQGQQGRENRSTGNAALDNALAILSSLLGLFSGSADPHSRVLNSQMGLDGATEATQEAISAPLETEPKRSGAILKGSALKAMFTTQLSENKERLVADMKRTDSQARHANPAT